MTTLNDTVAALFAALPAAGDNPVGTAARSALLSRLEGATPGEHSQPWPQSSGPSFLSIFFPNWTADPNLGAVTPATGLDDGWWSGFAVVALCQAMSYVTTDLRPQMLQPSIDNQVAALNAALQPKLNGLYATLLTTIQASPASTPFSQIPPAQYSQAAQIYSGLLQNPAWIVAKAGQEASGQWTDQVWELLHHWIKLSALGMASTDIDTLIGTLVAASLPVPASVGAGAWESFAPWMTPAALTWQDLGDASPGILAQVCTSVPGSEFPSCMNEENSFEFTANSQPGNQWRQAPGGSCFLPGTRILMADGSTKAIEAVTQGDAVKTRSGTAKVLATVSLTHASDRVYGLNGTGFRFTRTHPFLTMNEVGNGSGPRLACADPVALMNTVPCLSAFGLAGLGAGCVPLAGFGLEGVRPVAVTSLDVHPLPAGGTAIHDLIVDFDADGFSEYIAGDGTAMFAVSAEAPRFGIAPAATQVILALMEAGWPVVRSALAGVSADRWADVLYRGLFALSTTLLPDAIRSVQAAPTTAAQAAAQAAAESDIRGQAAALASSLMVASGNGGAAVYDSARGAFLAALMTNFGEEIEDAIALGWRGFPSVSGASPAQMAVSILSAELLGSAALPAAVEIGLEVTLGSGSTAELQRPSPIDPLPAPAHGIQIGRVAYFGSWSPRPTAVCPLTVILSAGVGGTPICTGTALLPGAIPGGYRLFNVPLTDGKGGIAGQLSLDVRPLDAGAISKETEAAASWTAAKQTAFAAALATALPPLFTQRFAAAAAPYLHQRG